MILQSLEELGRSLKGDSLQSVYVLLGPEQYQCRKAIKLLKQKVLSPESMAFDYAEFAAGDAPLDEIIEALNTFPMLSKRKLVLLTDADKLKDSEQEKLLDSLKNLSPRSMLILLAEDLDRRKRFYKTLRDTACIAHFAKLKGFALERWVETFVRNRGYRISSVTTKKIVDLAGTDLQTLANEIEKLLLYAGESKDVSDAAVEDLIHGSRQNSIFELIAAMGRRDRGAALRLLANLLNMGEHPLVVVTMMARHCRQVLIAKDHLLQGSTSRDIGIAAQIPAFILDQFVSQARSADSAAVQMMMMGLAEIDRRLKSSSADGRMLLERLICSLV